MYFHLYEAPSRFVLSLQPEKGYRLIAAGSLKACEAAYRLHDPAGYAANGRILRKENVVHRIRQLEEKAYKKYNILSPDEIEASDPIITEWKQNLRILKEEF